MSENNEGEENVHKGNEWEVVALTESAYAAAPGPQRDIQDNSRSNLREDDNADQTGGTMFMSRHFGLPPSSAHENLPLEHEYKDEKYLLTKELVSDSDVGDVSSSMLIDKDQGMPSNVQKHNEEDKSNELPDPPRGAWWRRHAVSLYGRVRNANPYWSIVVVAAVVGLVIIGHRWHRSKPQVRQVKLELTVDDERSSHSSVTD